MPLTLLDGLKACVVAVAVLLATVHAADPKDAPSPVGLNRDQVLRRYGEPRSQIEVGNRVIMFFARERLVLRDGVVVEVERLAAEPPRRPAPVEPAPVAGVPPVERPAGPPVAAPGAEVPEGAPVPAAAAPAPAAPAPEPKLEIKLVRPPSADSSRSSTSAEPTAPVPPAATSPAPEPRRTVTPPATSTPREPSAPKSVAATPAAATETPAPAAGEPDRTVKTEGEKEEPVDPAAGAAGMKAAPSASGSPAGAVEPKPPNLEGEFLIPRTSVIAFIVIAGGIGYLVWRRRQRKLLLEVSAVSHAPFSSTPGAATPMEGDPLFTADMLSKLEWKRFEELVADYYRKTGVVAVRTKAGPGSPVHIRISWKGEPRPFACVQCIAHPIGLIDEKPLQDLVAVLKAEDIRRGYVVTTGSFILNARTYAEENHLTLLPGELFLEKLNALPESARKEIRQATTNGDWTSPSCPKCEVKMVRSAGDPPKWRCPAHGEQEVPTRR